MAINVYLNKSQIVILHLGEKGFWNLGLIPCELAKNPREFNPMISVEVNQMLVYAWCKHIQIEIDILVTILRNNFA